MRLHARVWVIASSLSRGPFPYCWFFCSRPGTDVVDVIGNTGRKGTTCVVLWTEMARQAPVEQRRIPEELRPYYRLGPKTTRCGAEAALATMRRKVLIAAWWRLAAAARYPSQPQERVSTWNHRFARGSSEALSQWQLRWGTE